MDVCTWSGRIARGSDWEHNTLFTVLAILGIKVLRSLMVRTSCTFRNPRTWEHKITMKEQYLVTLYFNHQHSRPINATEWRGKINYTHYTLPSFHLSFLITQVHKLKLTIEDMMGSGKMLCQTFSAICCHLPVVLLKSGRKVYQVAASMVPFCVSCSSCLSRCVYAVATTFMANSSFQITW